METGWGVDQRCGSGGWDVGWSWGRAGQRGLRAVRVGQEVGRGVLWKALVVQGGGLAALSEASIVGGCRGAG